MIAEMNPPENPKRKTVIREHLKMERAKKRMGEQKRH
jgi:hypothetical protein